MSLPTETKNNKNKKCKTDAGAAQPGAPVRAVEPLLDKAVPLSVLDTRSQEEKPAPKVYFDGGRIPGSVRLVDESDAVRRNRATINNPVSARDSNGETVHS